MATFPATFNLSELTGLNGFVMVGARKRDSAGASLANAGDVNGDGIDDLVIGAPYQMGSTKPAELRSSYVVFGHDGYFAPVLDLGALDGGNGFRIASSNLHDGLGYSVVGPGDVTGDGFDDVMVGSTRTGEAWIVSGHAGAFPDEFALSSIDGTNGFRIWSADRFFHYVSAFGATGDMNGDGRGDLVFESAFENAIVFGKASGFGSNLDPALALNGSNGFRVSPETIWVGSAGDINHDGYADMAGASSYASYVVFGRASGFSPSIGNGNLGGNNGFNLDFARLVAGASDLNGDGIDDLLISGQPMTMPAGVLFGRTSGFPSQVLYSAFDGSGGFAISQPRGTTGVLQVSGAGDVNGDGYGDFMVGSSSSGHGGNGSGSVWIVFGHAGSFAPTLDLDTLDAASGFRIDGFRPDQLAGMAISSLDINGDGISDLAIGAPGDATRGRVTGAGAVYVLYGQGALDDTIDGDAGADRLDGADGNNRLFGRGGNDTLVSGLGDDLLNGGSGEDWADYSAIAADLTVDLRQAAPQDTGGAGIDQLLDIANVLAGAGSDLLHGSSLGNFLQGNAGDDRLLGGGGDDVIAGNAGRDVLKGGDGRDRFVFYDVTDSVVGKSRDLVVDFTQGEDCIDLSAVPAGAGGTAGAFAFIGATAFTGSAWELRQSSTAAGTLVEGDADGDRVADIQLLLKGDYTLTMSDFLGVSAT